MAQGEPLTILPSVLQSICAPRYASVPYVVYWIALWLSFKVPDVAHSGPEALEELEELVINQETPYDCHLVKPHGGACT